MDEPQGRLLTRIRYGIGPDGTDFISGWRTAEYANVNRDRQRIIGEMGAQALVKLLEQPIIRLLADPNIIINVTIDYAIVPMLDYSGPARDPDTWNHATITLDRVRG